MSLTPSRDLSLSVCYSGPLIYPDSSGLGCLPFKSSPSSALDLLSPFFPEQPTPASAYNFNYDLAPLDSGHLAGSHEALDLEGEAEDR